MVGGQTLQVREGLLRMRNTSVRNSALLVRSKHSFFNRDLPPTASTFAQTARLLRRSSRGGEARPSGAVEKVPQGKNACGAFAALARNTSIVGRQTNPRSSLGFDIHHSRQTLIHHSRLTRDETPPSSRVGALARRIEGEPRRIGSAPKGSALRYAAFGGYSG